MPATPSLAARLPAPPEVSRTGLWLRFVGEDGQPVVPATAEILCVGWGTTERIALRTEGNGLRVPLDEAWLRSRWPAFGRTFDHEYLHIHAPGFGAVRSRSFRWIGGRTPHGKRIGSAEISFPDGSYVTVPEGEERTLSLVLRHRPPRRLKLVDIDGRPVPGLRVMSYMFWSQENHCAVLAGADPLGDSVSDSYGAIEVPYGDFEYAFELDRSPWVFAEPEAWNPWRLITELRDEETELRLRERPIRALALHVTEGGEPAAGVILHARLAGVGCGADWGQIARGDQQGHVLLPGFRPEEYREIYFTGDDDCAVWSADPRDPRFREIVEVDLPRKP